MTTYIGFDAISTLSEEAHNPRRNILLATVLTCLITGILASVEIYAAQLVWPFQDPRAVTASVLGSLGAPFGDGPFQAATTVLTSGNADFGAPVTAIFRVAGCAGGSTLLVTVTLALLAAQVGLGAAAHLAGGRLLYGMGRDNAIPRRFFGAVDARTGIPRNNILLVGVLALVGAFSVNFALGCELLNFGALIGFMGVNLAAFVRYFLRSDRKTPLNLVLPIAGFLVCLYLWLSLQPVAKIVGLSWLATGLVYGAWSTGWFRRKIEFAVPPDEETTPSPTSPK